MSTMAFFALLFAGGVFAVWMLCAGILSFTELTDEIPEMNKVFFIAALLFAGCSGGSVYLGAAACGVGDVSGNPDAQTCAQLLED